MDDCGHGPYPIAKPYDECVTPVTKAVPSRGRLTRERVAYSDVWTLYQVYTVGKTPNRQMESLTWYRGRDAAPARSRVETIERAAVLSRPFDQ